MTNYRQASAPGDFALGNIWFDSDDEDRPYWGTGSAWAALNAGTLWSSYSDATELQDADEGIAKRSSGGINFTYSMLAKRDANGNMHLGLPASLTAQWGRAAILSAGAGTSYPQLLHQPVNTNDEKFLMLNNAHATGNGTYTGIFKYNKSSCAATAFISTGGQFTWQTAAPGTAGNTITWTDAMTLTALGRLGVGTTTPTQKFEVVGSIQITNPAANAGGLYIGQAATAAWSILNPASVNALTFRDDQFAVERMRIDGSGNLLVGATSGSSHVISKAVPVSTAIASIISPSTAQLTAHFIACDAGGFSTASAGLWVGKVNSTGRSINAGGTINASGADYAEYVAKGKGCGTIAKGDVCGVDGDGNLTTDWAKAVSFVVKSTDPAYVGGDSWFAEQPPVEPATLRPEPVMPSKPRKKDFEGKGAYEAAVEQYVAASEKFADGHAAWSDEKKAHDTEVKVYDKDKAAFDARLEAARQTVDRIAFSGQVPCNVSGKFAVGDYIVAAQDGKAIKAVAIPEDEIEFSQYRKRIGKVWAVRDDRAWIDVQHG